MKTAKILFSLIKVDENLSVNIKLYIVIPPSSTLS